ncbi:MAG: peptide deformylase [Oscillospiraceae bacterium]
MAIRNIVQGDDPLLRKKSRDVTDYNKRLHQLLDDMYETMQKAEGVGLAAVQVGALRRVIVVDVGDGKYEIVNPVITFRSEEEECAQEGCLSFPGEYGAVPRPAKVSIEGFDRHGAPVSYTGEGYLARAFCHEVDHLDGIVFHDREVEMPEGEDADGDIDE